MRRPVQYILLAIAFLYAGVAGFALTGLYAIVFAPLPLLISVIYFLAAAASFWSSTHTPAPKVAFNWKAFGWALLVPPLIGGALVLTVPAVMKLVTLTHSSSIINGAAESLTPLIIVGAYFAFLFAAPVAAPLVQVADPAPWTTSLLLIALFWATISGLVFARKKRSQSASCLTWRCGRTRA